MTNSKTDKTNYKMDFEQEKLDLVKMRIRNGFYERSDVLERVILSIMKDEEIKPKNNS